MKKSLILIPLVAAVIAVIGYSSLSEANKGQPKAKSVRVVPVMTGIVDEHELSQQITLIGKLEANQSVYIAPEVQGKIKTINVNANEAITAGQVLIELEDARAKSNLIEANAYLLDEKRKLAEFNRLIDSNAITQTEIDGQQASVEMAAARLSAAQAELDYHYIRAPFSGTAGLVDFSLGKMVSVGNELLSLDDLSSMRLDIQVPETYLSQISVGMQVSATNRAWPKEVFFGEIVAIDPRINQDTLNMKVRVNFDNSKKQLKPGMLMSANLTFPAVLEPVIPVQALEYSGTKRYVYVVDEHQMAKRTQVTLGARIQDEVLISEGVNVGDRIVVQGLVNMRDGLKVDDLSITADTQIADIDDAHPQGSRG